MNTIMNESKYTAIVLLTKKIPNSVIRYLMDFAKASTKKQRLEFATEKIKSKTIKGNKAKVLAFLKREWYWLVDPTLKFKNPNYLRGLRESNMVITYTHTPNWKWSNDFTLAELVSKILDENDPRLCELIEILYKYLLDNKYFK